MLILVLPSGVPVYDPGWLTESDVMESFHGFGVNRAYGQLQTDEGEPLTEMLPFPPRQPPDPETTVQTSPVLG